ARRRSWCWRSGPARAVGANRLLAGCMKRPVALRSKHGRPRRDAGCGKTSRPLNDLTVRELREALDEELARLPERYRAPLVLCYPEGATRDGAARQLGLPTSTLKVRVDQGRERLRQRLLKRGLALSAALSAVAVTAGPAPAELLQAAARVD